MSAKNDSETTVFVLGESPIPLWGIHGQERLRRQLRALGVGRVVVDPREVACGPDVLILRGDYLYDDRVLRALVKAEPLWLLATGSSTIVAAKAKVAQTEQAAAVVLGESPASAGPELRRASPAELSPSLLDAQKKAAPPLVLPIRAAHREALERYLFDGAYKGTTDLVTKWLWPPLARRATHLCARNGIMPNAVTSLSLVLALTVIGLFASGHLAVGLCLGWVMTFLDTVDGKLARVTVTSTEFGNYFDHLIDLIHPPFWYAAWGFGIATGQAELDRLWPLLGTLLFFYVLGRLLEGSFKKGLAGFTMFVWRPFDSYFRLILARRNPNLLLLTGSAWIGAPALGLWAVVVWTLLSSFVLGVRVVQAILIRLRGGSLRSWLADLHVDYPQPPGWARPFAPEPLAVLALQEQGGR